MASGDTFLIKPERAKWVNKGQIFNYSTLRKKKRITLPNVIFLEGVKKTFPSVGGCVGYHVVPPITIGIRLDHRVPTVARLSLVIKFEIFCRLKIIF